jgi:pimeloyl-ACP methyl ester carboxylesterase
LSKVSRRKFIKGGTAAVGLAVLAGVGYVAYQSVKSKEGVNITPSKAYTVERRQISLKTERVLDVVVAGPKDGIPLVFHHGSPGAAMRFEPFIEAAVKRGLRYVSYSRPGFGDSTRQPGRTVADCSADTANIIDELGADRFYVTGWSAGGPHSLACAALLPQRVIAASTIAGVAPYGAKNLDWEAGQDKETVEKIHAAINDPAKLQSLLEREEPTFAHVTGGQIIAALGNLPDVDKAVLGGQVGDFLAENIRESFKNGIWGIYDENIALSHDWGFDLSQIKVSVTVWQGTKDEMVPFAHGQWLANNVPNAHARLLPDQAHLSLVFGYFDKVLDNLIANGEG